MTVKALRKLLWLANTLLVLGIVAYALFFFILSGVRREGARTGEQFLGKRNLPEAAPDVKTDKIDPYLSFEVAAKLVIDGEPPAEIVDGPTDPIAPKVSPLAQDYDLHWLMEPRGDVLGAVASLIHKSSKKYVHVQVGEYVGYKRTGNHTPGDWKLVAVSTKTPWTAEFVAVGADGAEQRVTLDQVRDPHPPLNSGAITEVKDPDEDGVVHKVKEQPRDRPTRELVEVRRNEFEVPPEETEWWGQYGEEEMTKKVALETVKVDGKPNGLMFRSVDKGSMMERRGVKSGDILKSINGKPVSSRQGVINYVNGEGKGLTRYIVVIERDGKEITRTYHVKPKKK